jgi:hypothetical protein
MRTLIKSRPNVNFFSFFQAKILLEKKGEWDPEIFAAYVLMFFRLASSIARNKAWPLHRCNYPNTLSNKRVLYNRENWGIQAQLEISLKRSSNSFDSRRQNHRKLDQFIQHIPEDYRFRSSGINYSFDFVFLWIVDVIWFLPVTCSFFLFGKN